jgi:hypothetical protein
MVGDGCSIRRTATERGHSAGAGAGTRADFYGGGQISSFNRFGPLLDRFVPLRSASAEEKQS